MTFNIGDTVYVDEGDSVGCADYSGIVHRVHNDETITVRLTSKRIGPGPQPRTLRRVHVDCAEKEKNDS